jgi:hypothetical protein
VLGDVAPCVDAACTPEVGPVDPPHPAKATTVMHSEPKPEACRQNATLLCLMAPASFPSA